MLIRPRIALYNYGGGLGGSHKVVLIIQWEIFSWHSWVKSLYFTTWTCKIIIPAIWTVYD